MLYNQRTIVVARPVGLFDSQPVGESETVPGEARTIRQLYERMRLGQPLAGVFLKEGVYIDGDIDKDEDLEKVGEMHLDEQLELTEQNRQRVADAKAALDKSQKRDVVEAKKRKDAEFDELAKRMAQNKQEPAPKKGGKEGE